MTVRIVGLTLSRGGGACLVEDGVLRSALPLGRTAPGLTGLVNELLADAGLATRDIDHWISTTAQPGRQTLCLPDPSDHLALASAAFCSSGLTEAAALAIDTAETGFHFRIGEPPKRVFEVIRDQIAGDGPWLPDDLNGISQLYRVITLALGFSDPRLTVLDRLFIGDLEFEAPEAEIPRQVTDPARRGALSPLARRPLRFHSEPAQRSK